MSEGPCRLVTYPGILPTPTFSSATDRFELFELRICISCSRNLRLVDIFHPPSYSSYPAFSSSPVSGPATGNFGVACRQHPPPPQLDGEHRHNR
ncbi:predicted protein [Histoplasma capsulatum G186AR]|uniref:Uncharacterized protein n=1 Tax=Ajellomyces capsulatus (strain G186AR / H82 / ATCC MYA-2454 / RMSCC 2432) TaxID=447093 RepID=C0NQQ3_AJECG|nr:uncharacterized protein HCBG_05333 [Histoplasma capsulatum G186AR]EEH06017.1 predicted protein [Histoplasma capsulatum G186AR]